MTIIDITERKNTELKLRKSKRRYSEAYEIANLYKDLLAHDMNNILQNIKSAIQLEKMDLESHERSSRAKESEYLEIIEDQLLRGTKLISNIRKLTKLEEVEVNRKEIVVFKTLNKAIAFVKNSHRRKKIDISIESFRDDLKIRANEFLSDVFENILINAVKYNEHEHVIIHINLSKETQNNKDYLKMEFLDNGIGISDEDKEIIFDTGNIKGSGSKGMGFGLTLVRKIVENLQGSITVENKVEDDYTKGSNFIIRLPYKN